MIPKPNEPTAGTVAVAVLGMYPESVKLLPNSELNECMRTVAPGDIAMPDRK